MNILLAPFDTPLGTVPFEQIRQEEYLPALKEAISIGKKQIEDIILQTEAPTFDNTLLALEQSGQLIDRLANILFNLNTAHTNPELQGITREASGLLTTYSNDIRLNEALFKRIEAVYLQKDSLGLDSESLMLLQKTYKSFARNGAHLPDAAKEKLRAIDQELSELTLQFAENVLHESNDYLLEIVEEADLAGLPESAREMARQSALEKGKSGWVFTLQQPSYMAFMTYADRRPLREQLYRAYMSKANKDNAYDNRPLIKRLVSLRHQRAQLLGYAHHADFVLEERMAGSAEKVQAFLKDLLHYAKPAAEAQMQELLAYAQSIGFAEAQLQRWDFAYYAEKLKKEKYAIDDETLRPYFKLENVLQGMFEVARRLFGIRFEQRNDIPRYHPEVETYEVKDADGRHLAVFYADFFPRESKKGGAWMTSYREQHKLEGEQRPHVSIVCNFTKATPSKPSLLSFGEVTTLFHEFGHALHGLLADTKYQSLSGTSVYWDFVELPSQIMENWCYEKDCLDLFARHYESNEPIPQELIQKIKESANFMEGYSTLRQLSFGLLDMAWHAAPLAEHISVEDFEQAVFAPTELFPKVAGTCMSTQFNHIFSGGYAAGYYSYKWAEVLDADAFELFQEKGIFDANTALAFRRHILSQGGTAHPMELYKRFRGQEPSVKALLRRSGLLSA